MSRAIKWGLVTVPYTAMWTEENERREPTVVYETWAGRRLALISEGVTAIHEGKPLFKVLHSDRCREVLRDGLCQMCVRPLPRTVYAVNQGRVKDGMPHLTDGLPMCLDCAIEALNACPGMQRQVGEGKLRMFSAPRGAWLYVPAVLGMVAVSQGGNEKINDIVRRHRHEPVFGAMGLALTSWKCVRPVATKTGYILRRS